MVAADSVGKTRGTRNRVQGKPFPACLMSKAHRMHRRRAKLDRYFENVGQDTSKKLPRLSWRRLVNPDRAGLSLVVLFVGTLVLLAAVVALVTYRGHA
jgi:hypothetical protein